MHFNFNFKIIIQAETEKVTTGLKRGKKKKREVFKIISMLKNEELAATVINSFLAKTHCSKTLL